MNLLPLCQTRQALQGATAPARRFERHFSRGSLRGQRVQRRKTVPGTQWLPKMVQTPAVK